MDLDTNDNDLSLNDVSYAVLNFVTYFKTFKIGC